MMVQTQDSVILLPDKDLRYEILVKAMDISRKKFR